MTLISRSELLRHGLALGFTALLTGGKIPMSEMETSAMADSAPEPEAASAEMFVYVGSYTFKEKKGITLLRLDMKSGELKVVGVQTELANPTFLAIHPNKKFLYCVNETSDFNGKKSGAVSAFSIHPETGALTFMNSQSSVGTGPCHITIDKKGKFVLIANYGGGSVASLPVQTDGKLGESVSFIQHEGSSLNKQRQEAPHAHSINLDPGNKFVYAADLGLDKILIYKFNPEDGKMTVNDPPYAQVRLGAGPRHFAFHPTGKFAYVINELNNTIVGFKFEQKSGALIGIDRYRTLPQDYTGVSHTAEVVVSPDGKFVYGSNRGHDSLAIFAVNQTTGDLTVVGHEPTRGKTPRNFVIDPSGKFLLAANQDTDDIYVFLRDTATGKLNYTGHSVKVTMPVCLRMIPAP